MVADQLGWGALLLREVERAAPAVERFAGCFMDHRCPDWVEHTVEELLRQRVFALALGYEDLNDHEDLRRDPLLATVVGKSRPDRTGPQARARIGASRWRARAR